MVAGGEHTAGELEDQEIEGRREVGSEVALDDGGADGPQIVGEPDADARCLARFGLRILPILGVPQFIELLKVQPEFA